MKPKLLLKSLSASRSGDWNFSHIHVSSRAPAQCGFEAGGGQKHRADTTRPHCAPPQLPTAQRNQCWMQTHLNPSTHRARAFPNPPGLQKPPELGWMPKPSLQGQFCRFIKYPTAHSQTPAQPVQPGAHTDSLPLRYPFPVV